MNTYSFAIVPTVTTFRNFFRGATNTFSTQSILLFDFR